MICEDKITEEVGGLFKRMLIPQNIVTQIVSNLNAVHENKTEFMHLRSKELKKERDVYENRCEKIYYDRLDGRITDEEYDKFRQSFRAKISEIDTRHRTLP
jgi:hypothetical protein